MFKKLRWGGLAVILAVTMILAGCAGGDDRTAMEILEDMIEQEAASDYIHAEGSITIGMETNDAETGSSADAIVPDLSGILGGTSEFTIEYEIKQSTELARTDATLSLEFGGMTLEVPLILTETDLYAKIPMFTNDFVRIPLDTISENESTELDLDQIKPIVNDLASILKDILNEEWLTLQPTEEYSGALDAEELAYIVQLDLTNEHLQELLDRIYEEQDRIQAWAEDVEAIIEAENDSEAGSSEVEFSMTEEELREAKEELENNFDLEQFNFQVIIDNADHLREMTFDFTGKSVVNGPEEKVSLGLDYTVISINEPFEFEQDIPENAVLLEDLFSGALAPSF